MITKEQLDAVIKAVNEGGDGDHEITEEEVIAILRDTGLDTEIPYFATAPGRRLVRLRSLTDQRPLRLSARRSPFPNG